jgi:HEAT repeat protein
MTEAPKVITEARLKTSLNELVHSLVLELAMACKKLSIYSSGHPLGRGAIEKPYVILTRIFGFRKYVTFHTVRGQLHVCNICLKESVFTAQILQYMQVLDLTVLRMERSLTMRDFTLFLERFVRRLRSDDPDYLMSDYLVRNGIGAVEVNTEAAFKMFESQRQYRGEIDDDFSIKRVIMDMLGAEPLALARIQDADESGLLEQGIDFEQAIVRYLLPERIATVPAVSIRAAARELVSVINTGDRNRSDHKGSVNLYMALFKLVEWHPEREKILENLGDSVLKADEGYTSEPIDPRSRTGAIKTVTLNRIDEVLDDLFAAGNESYETSEFTEAFERLLKTGLRPKAEEVLTRLLTLLSDANPSYRQKSMNLMSCAISTLKAVTEVPSFEGVVNTVVEHLRSKRETYEYSELIWKLSEKCLADKRYDLLARITGAMAKRRLFDQTVTIYDSMAVKKAFETINRPEVIDTLVNELITADFERAGRLKEILAAIASEEVALALSQIIAHPVRAVRQQALKILAELGKASLKVFSRILIDDAWFERDSERYELPDSKWYTIRNSIFVLGSLRDCDAIAPLRLRISDHDIRVRREIISALEKIAGDDAVDVLIVMAEDPAREIRESAIGVIGIIGNPDVVPLLIDVARRNPTEAVRTVSVMGKLGGTDTRNYLSGLLDDETELQNLAAGKVSKDDLRLAIVKALGAIGDTKALDRIRQYQASLSTAQKILFKNSPVNKAITEILARK